MSAGPGETAKSAAFDPGAVHLSLGWDNGRIGKVALRVERPKAATAMRGRPADQAVRMMPMLYSICAAAQGAAARLALQAARGEATAPAIDTAVRTEALREHLWRLLLDWPALLGLPQQQALLVEGRRRLQDGDCSSWIEASLSAPFAAIEKAVAVLPDMPMPDDQQFLPALSADETFALWPKLTVDFAAAPLYRGGPAETGALSRHPELASLAPLPARIRARMVDLAVPGLLGRTSAVAIAPGVGRAAVETARGLLLHEISLEGDNIAEYIIVAPTEWNFHPAGRLTNWLEGCTAASPDAMKSQAERAVLALDPCVRCTISLQP